MAVPWAFLCLFRRTWLTRFPAFLRQMLDLALAPLLATTFVASAPSTPHGPLARPGLWTMRARLAREEFGKRPIAWRSTILGEHVDLTLVHDLARFIAARYRALRSCLPVSQFAVHSWGRVIPFWAVAVLGHLRFAVIIFAHATVDLSQSAIAPLPFSSAEIRDRPVAPLNTITAARAVTPFAPISKFAVAVLGTAVLVARRKHLVHTCCDMAAFIGLLCNYTSLPLQTATARRGTWPPITPPAPLPIDTMLRITGMLVALSDLCHRLGMTKFANTTRRPLD
jgi:hypothetical protein